MGAGVTISDRDLDRLAVKVAARLRPAIKEELKPRSYPRERPLKDWAAAVSQTTHTIRRWAKDPDNCEWQVVRRVGRVLIVRGPVGLCL